MNEISELRERLERLEQFLAPGRMLSEEHAAQHWDLTVRQFREVAPAIDHCTIAGQRRYAVQDLDEYRKRITEKPSWRVDGHWEIENPKSKIQNLHPHLLGLPSEGPAKEGEDDAA